jgi:O-acetyl-ADP-ribose deacetylase (regulator of RNase III)
VLLQMDLRRFFPRAGGSGSRAADGLSTATPAAATVAPPSPSSSSAAAAVVGTAAAGRGVASSTSESHSSHQQVASSVAQQERPALRKQLSAAAAVPVSFGAFPDGGGSSGGGGGVLSRNASAPAISKRQRRSRGVERLESAPLHHGGGVVVISRGSVIDFGGGEEWGADEIAIVNAANTGGLGGGGVDGAISAAGGRDLARDREALPVLAGAAGGGFRSYDRIEVGRAVATGPNRVGSGVGGGGGGGGIIGYGKLFAGTVIHAVGPSYRQCEREGLHEEEADELLCSAYRSAMALAKARGIRYLGFSLLSAGIFRGARSLGAVLQMALSTIVECGYVGLQEVHLIAYQPREQDLLVQRVRHYSNYNQRLVEAQAQQQTQLEAARVAATSAPTESGSSDGDVDMVLSQAA